MPLSYYFETFNYGNVNRYYLMEYSDMGRNMLFMGIYDGGMLRANPIGYNNTFSITALF